MLNLLKVGFLIFCLGCGYSSGPLFKKKQEIKSDKVLLNGSSFKETSRDINQWNDDGPYRVIYTFNKQATQVHFNITCLNKQKKEILSERQIPLQVQDPFLLMDQLFFEIPDSYLFILNVNDPPGHPICVEVLKTGKYQFIDRKEERLEVQINGLFYMYVKRYL